MIKLIFACHGTSLHGYKYKFIGWTLQQHVRQFGGNIGIELADDDPFLGTSPHPIQGYHY